LKILCVLLTGPGSIPGTEKADKRKFFNRTEISAGKKIPDTGCSTNFKKLNEGCFHFSVSV
jgi:hypothetical protein